MDDIGDVRLKRVTRWQRVTGIGLAKDPRVVKLAESLVGRSGLTEDGIVIE
jgi:hypothetical protein